MKRIIFILIIILIATTLNARDWDRPTFTENELIVIDNIVDDAEDEICKLIAKTGCPICYGPNSIPEIGMCINDFFSNNFWRYYFDRKGNKEVEENIKVMYKEVVELCYTKYVFDNINKCLK